MSQASPPGWPEPPSPERCKNTTLAAYLADHGLLTSPSLSDLDEDERQRELSHRDEDRIRIVKRLSAAPAGLPLKTIVSEVVKGQRPGQCERFDGTDADYQFAYRYVQTLADHDFAHVRDSPAGKETVPTTDLLDVLFF